MAFTVGNDHQSIFSRLKTMAPTNRFSSLREQSRLGASSPFTLLTPVEFAELFPKYYLRSMPDVKGFYDALSKKKSSGGISGGGETTTSTGASISSSEKVTNVVKAKEIYDYLRTKGIDHVHAAGIVNNMKYESNFNSGAIGDGGTSGGLFQHHASRFTAMKNYVEANGGGAWQTNWRKQIDYALTEGDMKTYLGRNFATASDASIGFTKDFERPANTETTAMYRSHTANGYADAVMGKGNEPAGGGSYEVTQSGYVVPRDKSQYDSRNEEQCATLAKGMNSNLGRTSGWSVVEGQIRPGMTVATMRYNLPGGDRTGAGYHSGVAMSSPDQNGNFLLLEQFSGQPPRLRQVNKDSYDGGALGGKTRFGVIQSNGMLHTEQSVEALQFGSQYADQEQRKLIQNNINALSSGAAAGSAGSGTGSVEVKQDETSSVQPQNEYQQQQASRFASTAQLSDVLKMHTGQISSMMDMISMLTNRGEGIGAGHHRRHRRHHNTATVEPDEPMFLPETRRDIGSITRQFETGKYGERAKFGVETISTGKHDKGGISYGEHQLASKTGTMAEFLKSKEGREFASAFGKTRPGTPAFNKAYSHLAAQRGEEFANAQHQYLDRTHYQPVLKRMTKMGFDTNDPRLQEAGWGGGIQFRGHMKKILEMAKHSIGQSVEDQVNAIQEAKRRFAPSIKNRFQYEAQAILGQKPGGGFGHANVMDISKYSDYMMEQKSRKAAYIAEQNKARMMAEQRRPAPEAPTVTNPLIGSGTSVAAPKQEDKPKGAVDFMPEGSTTDPNFLQNQQMTPPRMDKDSLKVPDKPQNQVSINPLEQRASHMQPTPSLARAMNNARGVQDSSYSSLSKTQIG